MGLFVCSNFPGRRKGEIVGNKGKKRVESSLFRLTLSINLFHGIFPCNHFLDFLVDN